MVVTKDGREMGATSSGVRWRWSYCCLTFWILVITVCHGVPVTTPARGGDNPPDQEAGGAYVTSTPPTGEEEHEVGPVSGAPAATRVTGSRSPWTEPVTRTPPPIDDDLNSTTQSDHLTPSTDGPDRKTKKPVVTSDRDGSNENRRISHQEAMEYLARYNYLSAVPTHMNKTGSLYRQNELTSALKHFQWFMGLNQTGLLDEASQEMMSRPRCGVPDVLDPKLTGVTHKRGRRYTDSGYRWGTSNLRYRISWYTTDLTNRIVKDEIRAAFDLWSEVTPLRFSRVSSQAADIDMQFRTREHGDGIPFDGRGKILAHAFYPPYGNVHFDDDENWSATPGSGISLRRSAAHEIGHALGLGHSKSANSLMAPTYDYSSSIVTLYPDDVFGIRAIYGADDDTVSENRPYCVDASIDAATYVGSTTYLFKDSYVYKIEDDKMAPGYPRYIVEQWAALPSRIDAVLHHKNRTNRIYYNYYFKGHRMWRYEGYLLSPDWDGVQISDRIEGLPDFIDSIHRYPRNGRVYVTKGDQYYRLNRDLTAVDQGYPKNLSIWWKKTADKSLSRIDAAFDWPGNRNKVYFFVGGQYYRYNTNREKLDKNYPRSTAEWWYGCTAALTDSAGGGALVGELSLLEAGSGEIDDDDYGGTLGPSFDDVIPPDSSANQSSVLNPLHLILLVLLYSVP